MPGSLLSVLRGHSMTEPAKKSSSKWKAACLLGAVTFLSCTYFYEGGGWNQNSRFDLLRAIVERHTLQIDAYHENTQDKAHFRGHYYSDKAPGLVLLAVPFAVSARGAMRIVGIEPDSAQGEFALSWIVTSGSVALPTALAAVCLFFLALRFGCDLYGAAFAALAMSIGTPMWAYASLFWAHALVGACLLFGFIAALKLNQPCTPQQDWCWALAVGLGAGWATVTEYPALPASALVAIFALGQSWPRGMGARWRVLTGVCIGAGVCAFALFSYLHAAFGSFRPSYSYYDADSFSFMRQQGYLGLTYPHPDRLLKLLFGCSRGIFFTSPVTAAAPIGLWLLWKRQRSWAALVAGGLALYYFLFNASFYWWKAGLAFGPRYAGAAIPVGCLGLALSWEYATVIWRRVLLALAVISVFITLVVISTTSQLAMQDSCPIVHSSWPAFWSGKMAMNPVSMLTPAEANGGYGAANLGQLLGLHGIYGVIPLLASWGIAGMIWIRIRREARQ